MLILRSILSPRDSTCSQPSNSVLPILLCSNSALTIFARRTCFWSSHLDFLSYLTFSLHTGRRRLKFACIYLHVYYSFYGMVNASNCTSTDNSLPPTINNSHLVRSLHFNNNSSRPRYFKYREDCSISFNYMVYMFSTRKGYLSIILGEIHRESFRLTEMHNLSLTDADLHVLSQVLPYVQGLI